MNRFLFLYTALLLAGSLRAQAQMGRNSVRLGVDLTSLDAPDAVGPRYVGRFARHFRQDRLLFTAEAGYMRLATTNQPFNGVDPGDNRRTRLTADVTVLADLLPSASHALRLGGGLSAWYRRDDIYRGATRVGLDNVAIDRRSWRGVNTGWHLAAEYEWLFASDWGVDGRFRVASLGAAGISSMLGMGISHRF